MGQRLPWPSILQRLLNFTLMQTAGLYIGQPGYLGASPDGVFRLPLSMA